MGTMILPQAIEGFDYDVHAPSRSHDTTVMVWDALCEREARREAPTVAPSRKRANVRQADEMVDFDLLRWIVQEKMERIQQEADREGMSLSVIKRKRPPSAFRSFGSETVPMNDGEAFF